MAEIELQPTRAQFVIMAEFVPLVGIERIKCWPRFNSVSMRSAALMISRLFSSH